MPLSSPTHNDIIETAAVETKGAINNERAALRDYQGTTLFFRGASLKAGFMAAHELLPHYFFHLRRESFCSRVQLKNWSIRDENNENYCPSA